MKHEFFLVIAPGLEVLAKNELDTKLKLWGEYGLSSSVCDIRPVPGGVEFSAALEEGFALNHILKIPTRILLRLQSFKAKDFSELFKRAKKVEWQRYLREGDIRIKVSTQRSRLKIKTRIEETLKDSLSASRKNSPFRKKFLNLPATIFVRAIEDRFELSVDTSGEPLYKRGWEKHIGSAPLRETLASALYFSLWQNRKVAPNRVIDPMCGSGTLLWEACDFFQVNRSRGFSYQDFPVFKGMEYSAWPRSLTSGPERIGGYDISSSALELVKANLIRRSKGQCDSTFEVNDILNFNDSQKLVVPGQTHWLVTNPPYDVRIAADLKSLASGLEALAQLSEVEAVACIWPQSHWSDRPFKAANFLKIKNGGIEVGLITYFK